MPSIELDLCPKCGGEIQSINYAGVAFLSCQNCDGFFIDGDKIGNAGALAQSDAIVTKERPDHQFLDQVAVACPQCNCSMQKRSVAKRKIVTLDICPSCHGIWFDSGEYAEYSGLEKKKFKSKEVFEAHLFCRCCNKVIKKPEKNQNNCKECGERLELALETIYKYSFWNKKSISALILFVLGMLTIYLIAFKVLRQQTQAILFTGTIGMGWMIFLIRALVFNQIAWRCGTIVKDFKIEN